MEASIHALSLPEAEETVFAIDTATKTSCHCQLPHKRTPLHLSVDNFPGPLLQATADRRRCLRIGPYSCESPANAWNTL